MYNEKPLPGLTPKQALPPAPLWNMPPNLERLLSQAPPQAGGWTEAQLQALKLALQPFGLQPLGFLQEKPPAPPASPPVPPAPRVTPAPAPKTKMRQIQDDLGRSFGFIQAGHSAIKGAVATGNLPAFNNGLNLIALGLEGYLKAVRAAEPEGGPIGRLSPGTPAQRLENAARGVIGSIQRGEFQRF